MHKLILPLLLLLLTCLSIFGDTYHGPTDLTLKFYDTLSIDGPAKLKLVKAQSLEVKGTLTFDKLDVAGKAEVFGTIKGTKGKFDQLDVTGAMDVDHVLCQKLSVKGPVTAVYLDVKDQADIEGPLTAQHSKFKNLSVKADKIVLDEVVVENIVVVKGPKNQVLILKGPTIVNGDIVFESGEGTVQIENPEVSIKGSIKGASIKK